MWAECRVSVVDAGPTISQHWVSVSSELGYDNMLMCVLIGHTQFDHF